MRGEDNINRRAKGKNIAKKTLKYPSQSQPQSHHSFHPITPPHPFRLPNRDSAICVFCKFLLENFINSLSLSLSLSLSPFIKSQEEKNGGGNGDKMMGKNREKRVKKTHFAIISSRSKSACIWTQCCLKLPRRDQSMVALEQSGTAQR